jgi:2,4-dienoyl-CoA reductase-like NADH-dependent reductase (Old Yellow Enzyme family)
MMSILFEPMVIKGMELKNRATTPTSGSALIWMME